MSDALERLGAANPSRGAERESPNEFRLIFPYSRDCQLLKSVELMFDLTYVRSFEIFEKFLSFQREENDWNSFN
jgi:hypothetical protein